MKAVIFDFGGVFIDSPFAAMNAESRARGIDPEVLSEAVFGAYDTDTDHPWHRLERGELSLEAAREEIMAGGVLPNGSPIDPFELLGALAGGGVRDDMVEFCVSLRDRGLATGLLTNNAREFAEFWRPLLPLEELFDDVVDSSEVGMRKPAAGIYRLALERLGVEAGEAVFIDDAPGNVAGAEAIGITSVLIGHDRDDTAVAIERLEALIAP
ncbi:MAG: HAD family phosphatase [Microthrixaceae bacterium]|nr:HAD family phosphatase [Microthrixaceae bacterium]MCO5318768.1 HAD family phosphatase [Microthrixaceae bacterium]